MIDPSEYGPPPSAPPAPPIPVPTLDGFLEASSGAPGVDLLRIDPMTVLVVETWNSVYRIVVAEGSAVFVQGGRCFPRPTRARLSGATFGGSALKLASIVLGMRMEIAGAAGTIVTTPVRAISIERTDPSLPH